MKLSIAALALAMAGSASAKIVFSPPLAFTQYDGDCSGDVLYTGEVVSIEDLGMSSFCIADNIETEEGTIVSFSKVEIVSCTEDKIYENWYTCDEDCADCSDVYHAYTNWESVGPDSVVGYCYDYTFSMDTVKTERMVVGTFEETRQINFSFDASGSEEDAKMYVDMLDAGSCIAAGPPVAETMPEVEDVTVEEPEEEIESGASTLAATAAVAMGAVATMLLA